jgi:hypothetical protein
MKFRLNFGHYLHRRASAARTNFDSPWFMFALRGGTLVREPVPGSSGESMLPKRPSINQLAVPRLGHAARFAAQLGSASQFEVEMHSCLARP